jgi:small-conductance mechanosensitive channel
VIALSGIGVDFTIVTVVVAVTLAAFGTGLAVTLALGSRDVVRNTINGIYTRRILRVGDRVRFGDIEGDIEAVGQVAMTLRAEGRALLVPYDRVIGSVLEIVRRGGAASAR